MATAQEAMLSYLSSGCSVIPLRSGDKRPRYGSWKEWQRTRPSEAQIAAWCEEDPNCGIGIVCGEVSDNLVVLDVDDVSFSNWLEKQASEFILEKTWTVRTGSGKLHVYLRSRSLPPTSVLKAGGQRLGEIRSDGAYVVAPPSIHPSGRVYQTLYGSVRAIATVPNAALCFRGLANAYYQQADLLLSKDSVPPPLTGDALQSLISKVEKVRPGKIMRALLEGASAGVGEWSNAPSNSDIDFAVVSALIREGWKDEEIEAAYATLPIGLNCYRRSDRRGSTGGKYLWMTIRNARASVRRAQEAAQQARGVNFHIAQAIKVEYDSNPIYELVVQDERGIDLPVHVSLDDLFSERAFRRALANRLNYLPELLPEHRGKKFETLANLIMRMAHRQEVPVDATASGHLRRFVLSQLTHRGLIPVGQPDMPEQTPAGWQDNTSGLIFVRGSVLIQRASVAIRPAPTPERIWEILRGLDGRERLVRYANGARERLWAIPIRSVLRAQAGQG